MYTFKGYVDRVDRDDVFLVMYDATDPRNPTEHWTVEMRHFPRAVETGEYVSFMIRDDESAVFFIDDRRWSAHELTDVAVRAAARRGIFRRTTS